MKKKEFVAEMKAIGVSAEAVEAMIETVKQRRKAGIDYEELLAQAKEEQKTPPCDVRAYAEYLGADFAGSDY